MANGTVYRLSLTCLLANQNVQNIHHFKGISNAATAQALCTDFQTNWNSRFRNYQSADMKYLSIRAAAITGGLAEEYELAYAANFIGLGGSGAAPPMLAVCVSLRTALYGRRRRGRTFFYGINNTSISNGLVSGSYKNVLKSQWDSFVALYGAGGTSGNYRYGVWSRAIGGNGANADPAGFQEITRVIIRDPLATVRKRIPGHGT